MYKKLPNARFSGPSSLYIALGVQIKMEVYFNVGKRNKRTNNR